MMNTRKFLSMMAVGALLFASCSDDDDNTPLPVNEEEVITTMTVTLTAGSNVVRLTSFDEDGADGPKAPEVTVAGNLAANTTYTGTVLLENETESPKENVNEEIEAEADEHQFFYEVAAGLNATISYTDTERDYKETGSTTNPVGIAFQLVTGEASTGNLTVTLRHMPKKPNNGSLSDAGGDTDIAQAFALTIE